MKLRLIKVTPVQEMVTWSKHFLKVTLRSKIHSSLLRSLARYSFPVFLLALPALLPAAKLTVTVKDPSGAVVRDAKVAVTGGKLSAPAVGVTTELGTYSSPDLAPAHYTITVDKDGFKTATSSVDIATTDVSVEISLALAEVETQVTVGGKGPSLKYANADPVYLGLRYNALGESFTIENFTLKQDVGTFEFHHGTLTFLAPINGRVTGAVFQGEGHFQLKPFLSTEHDCIRRYTGQDQVDEDFTSAYFRFTDTTNRAFLGGLKGTAPPLEAAAVVQHWQGRLRSRREEPISMTESLLNDADMDNFEAEILASVYNPSRPTFFAAFMQGKKHHDLRFFNRAQGAIPQILSPEEVGLINFDPEGMEDGIWYLTHTMAEFQAHTANSREDKRSVAAKLFKIDTFVGRNTHLASTATITFEPVIDGERVIQFGLLPNLRVQHVFDDAGKEINFIQEGRKADGSFYAILDKPAAKGQPVTIRVEYAGDKVIFSAGGGSFAVRARESWYPSLNHFTGRALYDLTFRVPNKLRIVAVGRLESEHEQDGLMVSHWVTDQPVAIAGFNYGEYKKVTLDDQANKKHKGQGDAPPLDMVLEGYMLPELPSMLQRYKDTLAGFSPTSMTKYALEQTRAQLQICEHYYGKSGFDRLYITEQPDFDFGQSWPNLVYLPISAYLDSTQRVKLFNGINKGFNDFIREVTPHEVAHQWWGHAVPWASYHDQWLSEGFAEFSAALFLANSQKDWQGDYIDMWKGLRRRIIEKNQFGFSPNDVGPVWMGERLVSPKTGSAYRNLVYPKGAFILAMIRSVMWLPDTQDQPFIDMMHDFVNVHRGVPASTESFKEVVERHMKPSMNLGGDGRMDWFFDQFVYGTEVPRYRFTYDLEQADGGKVKLKASLTQSEVSEKFVMAVPIFGEFDRRMARIANVPIGGNTTRPFEIMLPKPPKKVVVNGLHDILER